MNKDVRAAAFAPKTRWFVLRLNHSFSHIDSTRRLRFFRRKTIAAIVNNAVRRLSAIFFVISPSLSIKPTERTAHDFFVL